MTAKKKKRKKKKTEDENKNEKGLGKLLKPERRRGYQMGTGRWGGGEGERGRKEGNKV